MTMSEQQSRRDTEQHGGHGNTGRAEPGQEQDAEAARRRRRAQFLRERAEARALRERVQPRRAKVARLRRAMRMRTFRW
ncbi:hypothetical protein SGM_3646 [Streptomyces griseoaurantiacus M045]|uniref:Uncharacterized protein n=2 Tax=Streptomyces griseoaurantiacus TaxID=68213 RepID=F3NKI2_9ACTN|nr:hypothetical protein SGM_3646 [Streptomyces griseoaurantiacus M045]